uniref:C2H2-type domain-containing protein n=1 Tax=Parascaris univalens TaxID=6257 RepID=A0A915BNN6_PARUN
MITSLILNIPVNPLRHHCKEFVDSVIDARSTFLRYWKVSCILSCLTVLFRIEMSSQVPQNVTFGEQCNSFPGSARYPNEVQASSSSNTQAVYVAPSSCSHLISNPQYAAMMQRQVVLNSVMSISKPMAQTTPSSTFTTAQPLVPCGQQQMAIPSAFSYLPRCVYGSFSFLQPPLWLQYIGTPQTCISDCSTPDSGISVGTPYGAMPQAMLTPFTTPLTGFSPTSSCYFAGPSVTSQLQNTPTNIDDERFTRKRKGNFSHRTRRDYCNLCKSTIHAEGRRSQGPRRHVLQFHVMKPLYRCKLCEYSSPYDKYHIASHARRVHGTDRLRDVLVDNAAEFEDDIQYWTQKCFTANIFEPNLHHNEARILRKAAAGSNLRMTSSTPMRKKICGFAVEDLLAEDDVDPSQKSTPLNTEVNTSGSQSRIQASFLDVHQDSEASEDDGVVVDLSPNQEVADSKPKRLFVTDKQEVP